MIYLIIYLMLGIPISFGNLLMSRKKKRLQFFLTTWVLWPFWSAALLWAFIGKFRHEGKCGYCGNTMKISRMKEHIQTCPANPLVQKVLALQMTIRKLTEDKNG